MNFNEQHPKLNRTNSPLDGCLEYADPAKFSEITPGKDRIFADYPLIRKFALLEQMHSEHWLSSSTTLQLGGHASR